METSRTIDISSTMREVVGALGGVLLDEVLGNDSKKADYWFSNDNVVAELKCLESDLSQQPEFQRHLTDLHRSWVERGLLPRPTTKNLRFDSRQLPQVCTIEVLDLLKRRFETTVRRANRQIRESKRVLGVPEAAGLLLLANDGNYMFSPETLLYLLRRVLKAEHSSIDQVIVFSANMRVRMPGVNDGGNFWLEAVPKNRRTITQEFLDRFEAQWMAQISQVVGGVTTVQLRATQEVLDQMQFVKS